MSGSNRYFAQIKDIDLFCIENGKILKLCILGESLKLLPHCADHLERYVALVAVLVFFIGIIRYAHELALRSRFPGVSPGGESS